MAVGEGEGGCDGRTVQLVVRPRESGRGITRRFSARSQQEFRQMNQEGVAEGVDLKGLEAVALKKQGCTSVFNETHLMPVPR